MNVEGRERFFRAIAERIDPDRVEEVHVFPAIRQGGRESGVAVVTLRPLAEERSEQPAASEGSVVAAESSVASDPVAPPDGSGESEGVAPSESSRTSDEVASSGGAEASDEVVAPDTSDEPCALEASVAGDYVAPDSDAGPEALESFAFDELGEDLVDAPPPAPPRRFTVLRANYLLTLKGPDRGKWEVGVVEEADAPAATVDAVVRGVHERTGGWGRGAEAPERLTGDDFRSALIEEPWTAAR